MAFLSLRSETTALRGGMVMTAAAWGDTGKKPDTMYVVGAALRRGRGRGWFEP